MVGASVLFCFMYVFLIVNFDMSLFKFQCKLSKYHREIPLAYC